MVKKLINKKVLKYVVFFEIIIGGLALVFIVWALWNRPLGPSMAMLEKLNEQIGTSFNTSGLEQVAAGQSPQATPTPRSLIGHIASLLKPRPDTIKTVCGGPPVMTLLVIGSDQRSIGYQAGLADSIRLVRVDFTVPNVMTLDIPRDLWVEIPGISDHYGIDHGKINQAYLFGNPGLGYYDGPGEGPGLLARTLELNYGMRGVNHYVAMNMQTFMNMVDTIGGIDVYLNYGVDLNQNQDGAHPEFVLQPGVNHLDGALALRLSRDRQPTIFQRARYQDIVLKALKQKLLNPAIIPDLPVLIGQFYEAVQTDLSPNEINQLICVGQLLTDENIQVVAFPDDMFTSESTYDPFRQVYTFTLGVDNNRMRTYIANFMNGTWPQE